MVEKISIIDREKGQISKDFVKSVMDLHKFVNKEIEIWVINKKCKTLGMPTKKRIMTLQLLMLSGIPWMMNWTLNTS